MALRTFRSNPSLGGFGSKGSDGDAFCQIIKELVDNAVDACSPSANDAKTGDSKKTCFLQKRVRVVIEDFVDQKAAKEDNLLRVTVSDNGLGMNDIQACVDPFSTSKAHQSESSSIERATSGRYGIGLTLCLLHAQRLVPGSCTLIKSATRNQTHWTEVTCVVDTDRVVCIRRDVLPKVASDDSGTSISILVPVRVYFQILDLFLPERTTAHFLWFRRVAARQNECGPNSYVVFVFRYIVSRDWVCVSS